MQGQAAIHAALSAPTLPDGTPVVREFVLPGASFDAAGNVTGGSLTVWVRLRTLPTPGALTGGASFARRITGGQSKSPRLGTLDVANNEARVCSKWP